jgi:hypothetical protein
MLVGRLDGDLDGRPISLLAEQGKLLLEVKSFRSLLALHRIWKVNKRVLTTYLEGASTAVLVRIAGLMTIEVFPNPNYVASIFIPRG